jgi:hypothetical protein
MSLPKLSRTKVHRSHLYLVHPLAEPIGRRLRRICHFRRHRHEHDLAGVELAVVGVARVPLVPPFLLR